MEEQFVLGVPPGGLLEQLAHGAPLVAYLSYMAKEHILVWWPILPGAPPGGQCGNNGLGVPPGGQF